MKKYLVFTVQPIAPIFNVMGKEERDQIIEYYAKAYPSIPVYWQEVQEGEAK